MKGNFKTREYKNWKRIAESLQKDILKNEKAVVWWLENIHLVYDQTVEYPVNEVLPLCENTNKPYTKLREDNSNLKGRIQKEELEHLIDNTVIEEQIYQDLYWWNMGKRPEAVLKIKLKPYMLAILKARYVDGIRLTEYARQHNYADNYPHRVMTEIRSMIKYFINRSNK